MKLQAIIDLVLLHTLLICSNFIDFLYSTEYSQNGP